MFQLIFIFSMGNSLTSVVIDQPYKTEKGCQTAAIIAFKTRNWHDSYVAGSSMCVPIHVKE